MLSAVCALVYKITDYNLNFWEGSFSISATSFPAFTLHFLAGNAFFCSRLMADEWLLMSIHLIGGFMYDI